MLQDKYLPGYDICKALSIVIDANASAVYASLSNVNLQWSWLTTLAYKLRGLKPPGSFGLQQLKKSRFVLLETVNEREVILGLIGKFWTAKGHFKKFHPHEFVSARFKGYAKATWSFELKAISKDQTLLKTETRVFCDTRSAKLKFRLYWFFIQPFSSMIRKEILKSIKRQSTTR